MLPAIKRAIKFALILASNDPCYLSFERAKIASRVTACGMIIKGFWRNKVTTVLRSRDTFRCYNKCPRRYRFK